MVPSRENTRAQGGLPGHLGMWKRFRKFQLNVKGREAEPDKARTRNHMGGLGLSHLHVSRSEEGRMAGHVPSRAPCWA